MSTELDRSIPPQSKIDESIHLLEVDQIHFPNHVPLFCISAGIKEVIKIEFHFNAGSKFQSKALQASTVNHLLKNGTQHKSQLEINRHIEEYGAFLENTITNDHASLTLYTLNKNLRKVLGSVKEMLFDSVFSQAEIDQFLRHQKQNFMVNQKKVSQLANLNFRKALFSSSHPYGQTVELDDFSKLVRQELIDFHRKHYNLANLQIFASGYVGDEQKEILKEHFGMEKGGGQEQRLDWSSYIATQGTNVYIEKADAVQSAIKIGRLLFTKEHPDFVGMQVLSTILGGYFGSRLMRNIREDKGYTYGIGSAVLSQEKEGYFMLATEVGVEVTQNTLDEIYKEMMLLQQEKVGEKELRLVKNYTFGKMMRGFDGAFSAMDKFIAVHSFGCGNSYYRKKFAEVSAISSERLLSLANQYLKYDEMVEVVVGKK